MTTLKTAQNEILQLILKTSDKDTRNKLKQQQKRLSAYQQDLINKNVDEADDRYALVDKKLQVVVDRLKEAQEDIDKVIDIITNITKAVDAVGRLVDAVA
tara:strand:- start:6358 stop:6657 length:300 start_codon:yes stop_codon:yes gene_type:complete